MSKPFFSYSVPRINSLVFKLADYCNQGCTYCYRENDKERPARIMSDETILAAVGKYIDFLGSKGNARSVVYLIWHGGEPLLAGIPKFKAIMEMQARIGAERGVQFVNSVQTNGVYLNEEWAEFFSENRFLVGVSLDGPKEIHDIHRKNKNGLSTFAETMRGIGLLRAHKVATNLIGVITNESAGYADTLYDFFRDLGVRDIDLIPCFDYGDPLTLSPEAYRAFMTRIFKRWQADGYNPLRIRFLTDVLKKISALRSGGCATIGCELMGACGQNWSIGVEGEVYPCECLTPIKRMELGNIGEASFEQLMDTEGFSAVRAENNDIADDCRSCDVLAVCRAGCLNRRLRDFKLDGKRDPYCLARRDVIKLALEDEHAAAVK